MFTEVVKNKQNDTGVSSTNLTQRNFFIFLINILKNSFSLSNFIYLQ